MAISDCVRCDTGRPGEHNGWQGFKEWLHIDTSGDDLIMVCPNCITAEERADIEAEKAEDLWAMLRDSLAMKPDPQA